MYLDLNLVKFQYIDGFGYYHFCFFSLELLRNFWSVLGQQISVIFGSVLGLQVNTGLQPLTRGRPFVAGTILRRPEPTKERVEPTILSIMAFEITHLTRFALLLLLRIIPYMWRNHVTIWA